MHSSAFEKIMLEVNVHPKERVGFIKKDFDSLIGDERSQLVDLFFEKVANGSKCSEQLEWLLGDHYVSTLKIRLAQLSPDAHGRVFLPYFIYLKTRESDLPLQMMRAILEADPTWEARKSAIGGYLRELIGDEPVFFDFCRYVILNVPGYPMKRQAMIWLAYQKGVINELSLPDELDACVLALDRSNGSDMNARRVLDRVHSDTCTYHV